MGHLRCLRTPNLIWLILRFGDNERQLMNGADHLRPFSFASPQGLNGNEIRLQACVFGHVLDSIPLMLLVHGRHHS